MKVTFSRVGNLRKTALFLRERGGGNKPSDFLMPKPELKTTANSCDLPIWPGLIIGLDCELDC